MAKLPPSPRSTWLPPPWPGVLGDALAFLRFVQPIVLKKMGKKKIKFIPTGGFLQEIKKELVTEVSEVSEFPAHSFLLGGF